MWAGGPMAHQERLEGMGMGDVWAEDDPSVAV